MFFGSKFKHCRFLGPNFENCPNFKNNKFNRGMAIQRPPRVGWFQSAGAGNTTRYPETNRGRNDGRTPACVVHRVSRPIFDDDFCKLDWCDRSRYIRSFPSHTILAFGLSFASTKKRGQPKGTSIAMTIFFRTVAHSEPTVALDTFDNCI